MDVTRVEAGTTPRGDPDATVVESGSLSPGTDADASQAPEHPRSVGRYVIVEELGAGGMGRVYLAYDPKLRRELALKVLHAHVHADTAARGRMLREAQTQAQLSHPNVVPVYDVEVDGESLYIAMEYVRGQTLREWIETQPSQEAIIEAFLAAGRGLLAAHEAGLIHRDFKPANVLMGEDGRVRVMDFGLARGQAQAGDVEPEGPSEGASAASSKVHASLSASYTVVGSVVGTPYYMAPEQFLDQALDPRTDQYAFCISLVQALTGVDPFPKGEMREMARHKVKGEYTLAPELPNWIVAIVRRGLEPKPEARWPSMAQVLEQLAHDPARARRKWLGVAGALGLAGVLAAGIALRPEPTPAAPLCRGSTLALEEVWNDARRAEVEAAFEATGVVFAARSWTQVEAALDAYASEWVAARRATCEATRVHAEQSELMLDKRMLCFERRRDELDAFVGLLSRADASLVQDASVGVAGLSEMSSCDAAQVQGRSLPSEPEARAQLSQLGRKLAEATASLLAGHYAEVDAAAAEVERESAAAGYRWLEAEAALLRYKAAINLGELEASSEALSRALLAADAGAEDRLRVFALVAGIRSEMHKNGDAEAAERYRLAAAAVLERLGTPPVLELEYLDSWGVMLSEQGRYEEAIEKLERALQLAEEQQVIQADGVRIDLGAAFVASGRHARALSINREHLARLETSLGPAHPRIADPLTNVVVSLQALGQYDEALANANRLVVLQERTRGLGSPDTADAYNNRAVVFSALERYEEAAGDYERARGIWAELAPNHPRYGVVCFNLSEVRMYAGETEEALEFIDEAAAVFAATLPPEHPYNAFVLTYRGWALLELGRPEEAATHLEPGLALLVKSKVDARTEAQARMLWGELLAIRGELGKGRARIEQALAQLQELEESGFWTRRGNAWLAAHPG